MTDDLPRQQRRSYSTMYVAKRMGVSVPTIQRWVDAGQLLGWKTLGGHRRIDADSADALIGKHSGEVMEAVPMPAAAAPSVVIVDDNPDDQDLLRALVEEALPGAAVTVADNGFTGLLAIGQQRPDVVISDIQMPKLDGIEMLRQLSGIEAPPKVLIAVSSLTPRQLAQRGELPTSVTYIRKPIADPEAFMRMLRDAGPRRR